MRVRSSIADQYGSFSVSITASSMRLSSRGTRGLGTGLQKQLGNPSTEQLTQACTPMPIDALDVIRA
jgi:hypothetical protein